MNSSRLSSRLQPCARGLGIRRGLHKHILPLPTLIRPVDRHRRQTLAEGIRSGDALGLAVEDCVGEVLEEQAVVGLGHLKANAPEDRLRSSIVLAEAYEHSSAAIALRRLRTTASSRPDFSQSGN